MRSRNGNHYFSRRLCSIILFYSLTLSASEYLISYRYIVKDAILYNESLMISHAMKKCSGTSYKPLQLENNGSKNLSQIITLNHEIFINYIHKLGLDVQHNEETINAQNKSTTILTLKTQCFKVDFNDNFAKITPLK